MKENDYYKAYDKRYRQVYKKSYLWSTKEPSLIVLDTILKYKVSKESKILEIGCGEGRDAIYLLNNGYNVLAIDYSNAVIEKCRELSNHLYDNNFKQFDIMNDVLDDKYDFIYSVSVIHMFVNSEHRDNFYKFIYEHLTNNGVALITSMGDGTNNFETDITKSFKNTKRKIINNQKTIEVASTSCKIVDWDKIKEEVKRNNLVIRENWVSNSIPEFDPSMCLIIIKK